MKYGLLAYIGLFLGMVASLEQLITNSRRVKMISLGVLYLGAFLIVLQAWTLSLAAIKLIAGWMGTAILTATQFSREMPQENELPIKGRLFRVLAAVFVWILVFSITPAISGWLPLPYVILWSGLILIGTGVVMMGFGSDSLMIIIGLMTTLAGFEILYAAVENSVLVAGLLAVITLALALVGGYLIIAPYLKENE